MSDFQIGRIGNHRIRKRFEHTAFPKGGDLVVDR